MQKILTFFFSKNIIVYAIFNYQSFNDTLTNDIVSFEQLGPEIKDLFISKGLEDFLSIENSSKRLENI